MKTQFLQNATAKAAIAPVENDGTKINGIAIDRTAYDSGKVVINFASSSGTPDTAVAAITIEHDTDSGFGTTATFATLASALNIKTAGIAEYDVNLKGAKQYVRVTLDTTYSGGTSPKNIVASSLVLGDHIHEPLVSTVSP